MEQITWEEFKGAFIDRFFLFGVEEDQSPRIYQSLIRQHECKGILSQVHKASKYAPFMVVDPRARMSKSISGVSDLVYKECKTAMLVKEMDISHLMTYAE